MVGVNARIDLTTSRQLTRSRDRWLPFAGPTGSSASNVPNARQKGGESVTKIKRFASAFAQPVFWTSLFVAHMGPDRYPWR